MKININTKIISILITLPLLSWNLIQASSCCYACLKSSHDTRMIPTSAEKQSLEAPQQESMPQTQPEKQLLSTDGAFQIFRQLKERQMSMPIEEFLDLDRKFAQIRDTTIAKINLTQYGSYTSYIKKYKDRIKANDDRPITDFNSTEETSITVTLDDSLWIRRASVTMSPLEALEGYNNFYYNQYLDDLNTLKPQWHHILKLEDLESSKIVARLSQLNKDFNAKYKAIDEIELKPSKKLTLEEILALDTST